MTINEQMNSKNASLTSNGSKITLHSSSSDKIEASNSKAESKFSKNYLLLVFNNFSYGFNLSFNFFKASSGRGGKLFILIRSLLSK